MNVEERLRDALGGPRDRARPSADTWQAIRRAADTRRRRRRAVGYPLAGAGAVAVVVAFVLAIATLRGGSETEFAASSDAPPDQIVAITNRGIVVLSSADGRVERTILRSKKAGGASTVAPSADGKTVYFSRVDPEAGCDPPNQKYQIASVPTDGGRVTAIASGTTPVLSPDGKHIAFARFAGEECGTLVSEVVIQELDSGASSQRLVPLGENVRSALPLSWSPNGSRLLYAVTESGRTVVREFDAATGETRTMPVGTGVGALVARYLGSANRVSSLLQLPRRTLEGRWRVEAVNVTTELARELFTVSGNTVEGLGVDRSGRHLLVDVLHDLQGGGQTRLYRWSQGGELTKIANGIVDADWIP